MAGTAHVIGVPPAVSGPSVAAPARAFWEPRTDLTRSRRAPALVDADGPLTWSALAAGAERRARALLELDPHALVHLEPRADRWFVMDWLACLLAGRPALLTPHPALAATYRASVTSVGGADRRDAHGWRRTGALAPDLHPDLRLLLSTSGSTGSAKLVRLSATNLDSNARAIADYLHLSADDCAITTLPLDYCYGLSVLHSHLAAGATVVLDDRSVTDPGLWEQARAWGVTSFAGVPHTFELLEASGWPQLPSLRTVTQAGGRMAPERVRQLSVRGRGEGWDLVVMYGQTEATARMAYLPPDLAGRHPSCVGVPIPGGTIRLDPIEGADDGVGEVVYTGPNVMMGYASEPADLARGAEVGELRTGDLARRVGPDGLIEIVGRRSRFTKLFGQRIDLDRVEALLRLAGHRTTCVESADSAALVVAVPGAPDLFVIEEIRAAVSDQTALPAHGIRVVALDELPRLANGKPDLQTLAALTGDAAAAPDEEEATGGDVSAAIVELYRRVLHVPLAGPGDSFVSLGGDSLSYVEIALRLERRLGTLPPDWPRRSIADLAATATTTSAVATSRAGRWVRMDTTIALRALAILAIVGSHADLWTIVGGAHILLAVAGLNFARFHLSDPSDPGQRLRRVGRALGRIAVPSMIWIAAVAMITGAPGWRSVLLINHLTARRWSEPDWHYWFIEVVVVLAVTAGLLTSIPAVMRYGARHPFRLPALLAALTVAPVLAATWVLPTADVRHTSLYLGWLFAVGWASAAATRSAQRVAISVIAVAGVTRFTGDLQRDLLIGAGVLLLIWVPTLPWPRLLVPATGVLASASLFIYLTHWQVYPAFERPAPALGLLVSLAVGIVVWRLAALAPPLWAPRSSSTALDRRNTDEEVHPPSGSRSVRPDPRGAAAERLRPVRPEAGDLQRPARAAAGGVGAGVRGGDRDRRRAAPWQGPGDVEPARAGGRGLPG